jgi:deazaflavin-dependent oxidoreductase (nitroreductase family)
MPGLDLKYRVIRPLERYVVNPVVKLAWRVGLPPPGDALLETIGRRTRRPRCTPVCDGFEGETFWLVAQHGRRTEYVCNIEANPRVKVRSGSRPAWRRGTAHILDDDDPRQRQRLLGQRDLWRRLCFEASGAMATSPLTVRIDLDPVDSTRRADSRSRAAGRRSARPGPTR